MPAKPYKAVMTKGNSIYSFSVCLYADARVEGQKPITNMPVYAFLPKSS